MKRLLGFVACALLLLPACTRQEPVSPPKTDPGKKLTIGLIPEQNLFRQLERYQPLADYLSGKIGAKIELKILPRYGNIVDNFKALSLDGAFFGSFTYALAHSRLGVEVLARPEDPNGVSTYHGLIFVRKDSGIHSVRGMKGKRFALVDRATTAGYLLPMEYFHNHAIDDPRAYLGEMYYAGTHEGAIYDVLTRKADIGAAKNTVYERLAVADSRLYRELKVLVKSPDVPENGLAVRADLEEPFKKRLREAILSIQDDPAGSEVLKEFGASRFIETSERDYEVVYRYAREVHLDLAKYDYRNE